MKKYCPVCNCEQEIQLVKKQETYQIKGEPITIYANICTCSHCGEEIVTFDYDDENLKEAYRAYRHKHNLIQPESIVAIREQCKMDRETFAEMLGLDAKQIEDYENGKIPEKHISNLIMLMGDYDNVRFLKIRAEEFGLENPPEKEEKYMVINNVIFSFYKDFDVTEEDINTLSKIAQNPDEPSYFVYRDGRYGNDLILY